MIPAVGLAFASSCAILAWTRGWVFLHDVSDARLAGIILGLVIAAHWHRWRYGRFTQAALAFGACVLIPTIWSRDIRLSLFGYPGIYSGSVMTYAVCAAGLLIADQLDRGREMVKRVILCAGTLTAVVCYMQRFQADIFRLGPEPGFVRATGFLGSPTDTGALFVVLMTFAPRGFIPVYLAGIWATISRGAWLAIPVALAPARWRLWVFAAVSAFGISCALASPAPSDVGRKTIWRVAAAHLTWKGSGPATFWHTFRESRPETPIALNPAHTHNAILEAISTRGILGLLSLGFLLFLPELAALWTISLFNPVSFEVVFIACVLAGLSREPLKGETP